MAQSDIIARVLPALTTFEALINEIASLPPRVPGVRSRLVSDCVRDAKAAGIDPLDHDIDLRNATDVLDRIAAVRTWVGAASDERVAAYCEHKAPVGAPVQVATLVRHLSACIRRGDA